MTDEPSPDVAARSGPLPSDAQRALQNRAGTSALIDVSGSATEVAWAMVEASPDALLIVDERGIIELINSRTEEMFGYDRGDLLGREVELLMPEGVRQRHRAHRTRYRVDPTPRPMGVGLQLTGIRSDGSEFPVEVSLGPMHIGTRLRILAAIRDVSERSERDAFDREVRRGLDLVEDGVVMFDGDTLRFSYVNQGVVHQVGYPVGELLSMSPLHLMPEFDEESFRALLEPLDTGRRTSVHFSTLHRHQSGRDIPVDVVLQSIPAQDSGRRRYVAIVRDTTEQLERERQLAVAHERSAVLEDRERIAREMHDSVISQLMAIGLSLDATSPLIRDNAARARIGTVLERIDETIDEIRVVVFGRTGERQLERSVCEQVRDIVEEYAGVGGCEVEFRLDGSFDGVDDEVCTNLLAVVREAMSNTLRHARAARIEIGVDVTDGELRLDVVDDGVGFDVDDPPDSSPEGGHGLDNLLHRARGLGGTLHVDSSPGRGTRLTWTVPIER